MEAEKTNENILSESLGFWEKKRLLFNIVVAVSGIISVVLWWQYFRIWDIFGILLWALVANFLYTSGYLLESFLFYYSKGKNNLARYRMAMFIIGTLAYAVVNILIGVFLRYSMHFFID